MSERFNYDDSVADGYAEHRLAEDGTDGIVDAWMLRHLPSDLAGKTVIDAGCGELRWAPELLKRGAGRLIGVDASRSMLERAPGAHRILDANADGVALRLREIADRVVLVRGEIERVLLELADEADLVLASFVLCATEEPRQGLRAMHAALRRGGEALVSTNVIVSAPEAPSASRLIRPTSFPLSPVPLCDADGRRKELRMSLEVGGKPIGVIDRAHAPADYAADPALWEIEADLVEPQGCAVVEPDDRARADALFPDRAPADGRVLSLHSTTGRLVHLCMRLVKR